jgi:hypothetical protein
MTLKFPTMAEQALAMFRNSTKTTSLTTIAKSFEAERDHKWPNTIIWTFDDDTSLEISGRGRNHKVEAHLP